LSLVVELLSLCKSGKEGNWMAKQTVTVRVAGAPPLITKGEVKTVRDLARLFKKAEAAIRGTNKFLVGFSDAKLDSVTIRPE
jgi:hypothetical protein